MRTCAQHPRLGLWAGTKTSAVCAAGLARSQVTGMEEAASELAVEVLVSLGHARESVKVLPQESLQQLKGPDVMWLGEMDSGAYTGGCVLVVSAKHAIQYDDIEDFADQLALLSKYRDSMPELAPLRDKVLMGAHRLAGLLIKSICHPACIG